MASLRCTAVLVAVAVLVSAPTTTSSLAPRKALAVLLLSSHRQQAAAVLEVSTAETPELLGPLGPAGEMLAMAVAGAVPTPETLELAAQAATAAR